jgi:transcriptional regulator with XRE-family HTH domain
MGRYPRWRPVRLSQKLRQIRLSLELSQDDMLKRLGLDEGRFRSSVSNYEHGGEPELPILLRYARLVNVSTDVLIDDDLNLPGDVVRAAARAERLELTLRRRSSKSKQ